MTDNRALATALSGATRECEYDYHGNADPEIAHSCQCDGTGRVFLLGGRARKACPGCRQCVTDVEERIRRPWWNEDICDGSGWRSALLLPEEKCPGNPGRPVIKNDEEVEVEENRLVTILARVLSELHCHPVGPA